MSTSSNSENKFREISMELERARLEEVPAYSPKNFREASKYLERARAEIAEHGAVDSANGLLEQAREALNAARDLHGANAELLSPVIHARRAANNDGMVRYRVPELLAQAESAYRKALEEADHGRQDAVRKSVETALALFRDARLTGRHEFLIEGLASHVKYATALEKRGARDEALAVVSSLDQDLTLARAGDLAMSRLTARIVAAGNRISSLLNGGNGFDFGFEWPVDEIPDPGLDWAPGTFGPPEPPVSLRVTARTASSVTIRWRNVLSIADANIVVRRVDNGPWEDIAELPIQGEVQTFTDTGLQPDRLHCYRIKVRNWFGFASTPPDEQVSAYTRDGNSLVVGRAQLRIRVADFPNAGTSNDVEVRLNSPLVTYSPSGNSTWLDYGPDVVDGGFIPVYVADDFDRGRDFTYDLNLDDLSELGDITMISIRKEGNDALAIAELELIVNGVSAFARYFGETTSTVQWIDENSPIFTIFHPELRAHGSWPTTFPIPAPQIPNQELVDRLEGIIGDAIHGTPLKWGGFEGSDWVEVSRADDSTLHVTVDLQIEVLGPNLELDIEFDVNVAVVCSETTATLTIATSNFKSDVSFSLIHDVLSFGIVEFFDDNIEKAINAGWRPIQRRVQFGTGGLCPTVQVDQSGNLNFTLS